MLMQMMSGERTYQQQTGEINNCQTAYNRCQLATPDGAIGDELFQRPYRCHVCRIGFKKQVRLFHT